MKHHMPKDIYEPQSRNNDAAKSVLIMTADKTEDLEFFYPYYRLIEAGYNVDVVTPSGGDLKGKAGLGLKETKRIASVTANSYAMLFVPGGKAPAELKKSDEALALVQQFFKSGKPIAAICHGPQVLAAAGVIDNARIAAWPDVEDEVVQAGATYVNEETTMDGPFITARWPGDLPMFMKHVLKALEAKSTGRMAA